MKNCHETSGSSDHYHDFSTGNQLVRGKNSNHKHLSFAEVVNEVFSMFCTGTSLTNAFPRVSNLSLCALSVSLHANNHTGSNEYEKQL